MAQDKQTGPRPGGRARRVLRAGQLLGDLVTPGLVCSEAGWGSTQIASGAEPTAHQWISGSPVSAGSPAPAARSRQGQMPQDGLGRAGGLCPS